MEARTSSSPTSSIFSPSATVSSVRNSSSRESTASITRSRTRICRVWRRLMTIEPPKALFEQTSTVIPAVRPTDKLRSWLLRIPMQRLHSGEQLRLIRITPKSFCPSRAKPYCSSRICQPREFTTSPTASITSMCGTGFQLAVPIGVDTCAISSRPTNRALLSIISPIVISISLNATACNDASKDIRHRQTMFHSAETHLY